MVTTGACTPCQDSPLSITGNVIGILTFVYVLVIGLSYRWTRTFDALRDILELKFEIEHYQKKVNQRKNLMDLDKTGAEPWGVLLCADEELSSVNDEVETVIAKIKSGGFLGGVLFSVYGLLGSGIK